MEIAFGAVYSTLLVLGLWLNRHLMAAEEQATTAVFSEPVDGLLVAVHLLILVLWIFTAFPALDVVAGQALPMIVNPLVAEVASGLFADAADHLAMASDDRAHPPTV
jgi:hypothetical protein